MALEAMVRAELPEVQEELRVEIQPQGRGLVFLTRAPLEIVPEEQIQAVRAAAM